MSKSTKKFKTEVQQLLELVIHSLYSHKEIFLRELISNSADAIDRARFEALSNKAIVEPEGGWKIKLIPNKEDGTLTIRDTGVGMNKEEIDTNIGTIANSGTRAFMEQLKESGAKDNPELIGQFGVGFYSAFMVADKVTVQTKRAGEDGPALQWSSKGDGSYTVEDIEKDSFGTDIILHLKEEETDYLEEWQLRQIIKKYSDYIAFPVCMDITTKQSPKDEEGNVIPDAADEDMVEYTEEETLNSMKAIWTRSKSEVSDEEYNEFYKAISHDFSDPLKTIPYAAEGAMEFKSILYIPSKAPHDLFHDPDPKGVHLYIKRVFIMNDTKALLPPYLRFVKGVVDSSDLPLNVSREILQEDAVLKKIQKNLTTRVLKELAEMKKKDREQYEIFWGELGKVLKEGLHVDFANKDKLADLLIYQSANNDEGKMISLEEYVNAMPEDQKEIYFITGDSRDAVAFSPHLEAFKAKGYDVLFLTDPIDEWVVQSVSEFSEKKLKAVDRGDIDLDSEEEKTAKEEDKKKLEEDNKELLEKLGSLLKDNAKEVRFSDRLTDSASVLVADEMGMNANMERIMASMGQEMPKSLRILELNPKHKVVSKMQAMFAANAEDAQLADYAELLFGTAMLTEGSMPKNPVKFNELITSLMA